MPQPHLVVLFTVGAGTVASPSVFGHSAIAERLSPETVTATVRRESFDRARSSSKTNLPVWYTEVGSANNGAKPERGGNASSSAGRNDARSIATPLRSEKTLSGDALRSAALSGMKGSSRNALRATDAIATSVKGSGQSGFEDMFVMLAPEGSPAFVAYARGVAALRTDSDKGPTIRASEHDGSLNEGELGERPEGIWERLLAFFGFGGTDRERRGSERIGFASE